MAPVAVTPPRHNTPPPNVKYKVAFSEHDTHARDFHPHPHTKGQTTASSPETDTSIEDLIPTHPKDPHTLPSFDGTAPTEPILYLPPLLSSLPPGMNHDFLEALDKDRRPLNTDTHLPDIDPVSLALHKALHHFQPLDENYAETPYPEAFNWKTLDLPLESEREWYCVVFVSKRQEGSDSAPLYSADREAHEEAVHNGGLIMYWYGIPHPVTGMNLATCVWQSRKHAVAASSGPKHIVAMRLAAASFEHYKLHRYRLSKVKGEKHLTLTPWVSGDVGW